MVRSLLVASCLVLVPSVAAADRAANLGVDVGVLEVAADAREADGCLLFGASLAWDGAPPEYPAERGIAIAGDLVPELSVMRFGETEAAFAGARLELDFAQRELGLLRVSARGSFWIGGRVGVVEGADSAALGLELGETYRIGRTGWIVGGRVALLAWRDEPDYVIQDGGSIAIVPGPDERDPIVALSWALSVSRAY